jgi:hypothetical protein
MKKFTLFLVLIFYWVFYTNTFAQFQGINPKYITNKFADSSGKVIVEVIVPGIPPENFKMPEAIPSKAAVLLTNVPGYDWSFGCSATSAAMQAAYYDRTGYYNMYAGPTQGGLMPMDNSSWGSVVINGETRKQCPLSATRNGVDGRTSRGHADDYWVQYGSTANDPYITNGWVQHTWGECTGDYMGTNQSALGNSDGSTTFYFYEDGTILCNYTAPAGHKDGCKGLREFYESRGYTVTSNCTQLRYGYNGNTQGFTFTQYKQEIDAGRPVLIQVDGHTMLGYGYDNTGSLVYLRDTWDYASHTMTWGGSYGGLAHWGVTTIDLQSYTPSPCSNIISLAGGGYANAKTFWGGGIGVWHNSTADPCGYTATGIEQVYSFVAPVTGTYSIEVTTAGGTWVDYMWKASSCSSTGWSCIDDVAWPGTYGAMSWTAGTTYYILLDDADSNEDNHTWHVFYNPCLNITTIGGTGSGYSQTYAGGGNGSWYNTSASPCGFYCYGREKVYSFTAPVSGLYSIVVTAASGWVDYMWKETSCSSTGWNCIDDLMVPGTYGSMTMTVGTTYYILLDDEDTSPGSHTFYLSLVESAGTWKGLADNNWNNTANWSANLIPDATINVTIPAGTPFQPVISSGVSANCRNIIIQSGATLTQNPTSYLHVYGDFNSDAGQFTMSGNTYMYFEGSSNNSWDDDNENDSYTTVVVDKSVTTAQTTMWQNMTVSSQVQVWTGILAIDATWTLNITGTIAEAFNVHNGGKLILNDETITCAGGVHFWDGSQAEINGGTINCAGNFTVDANTSYNIAFTAGTLVMNGSSTQYINDLDGGNLDLFNLTIAKTGGVCYIQSANLDINGDLLISGGSLSCNNAPSPTATYNINIAGTWTNNVGTGGFIESTGRVIFDKPTAGIQLINSTEHFNILECATVSATAGIRPAGSTTVSCNVYDWTSGGVSTSYSTFTANDLADNSLYGFFYALSNSQIMLNEPTSFVDLKGDIMVSNNALLQVNGGLDESYWASGVTNNVTVETGGVLDFADVGIQMFTSGSLVYDIQSGSTIKVGKDFICSRTDFNPAGGTLEFHGGTDGYFSMAAGSTLYDVSINKTGGDKSNGQYKDRKGNLVDFTKSNSVYLSSNVLINNNVTIQNGTLNLNGHQLTVTNNCDVYGTLTMNNALDILNVGGNYLDALSFYSGSTGNFNFGIVNIYGWICPEAGCIFSATTNSTVYFKGVTGGGPWNNEPTAVFGHMVVDKNPGERTYAALSATQPIILLGDFTVNPNNEFELQNNTMHVNGFLTDNVSSEIYAWNATKNSSSKSASVPDEAMGIENSIGTDYNTGIKDSGSKGGYLEIDNNFTLNGLMDVGDGNVLLHGGLTVATTGILTITSGSFICDKPAVVSDAWQYINGTLNLTSGLFEITNNSPSFGTTASTNISGGIIRSGVGFNSSSTVGVFDPTGGVVEFTGVIPDGNIFCFPGNWFYNLRINSIAGNTVHFEGDTKVTNDVILDAGALACGYNEAFSLNIGSDFNNNVGNTGYSPGTGTVYFDGTGALNHQFINGTTIFYNIENAKSGGGYLRLVGNIDVTNNFLANGTNIVDGPTLDINNLLLSTGEIGLTTGAPNVTVNNFTMGGYLSVTDGNFTCNDVVNNGIFGTITMYNGSITLFQDAGQYPDFNATVNINGGYMVVNGGNGASLWGYGAPCNITMSNGVLDFNNNGIYIDNTYPLTESITGGTIKTNLTFYTSHVNFTPSGGTVEMYGGTDAYLGVFNNSNLYNLLINKSGGDKDFSFESPETEKQGAMDSKSTTTSEINSDKSKDRPKFPVSESKANTITTANIVQVNGTTTIEEGTFLVDNYTVTCMNNININAGGKLSIGYFGTLAIDNGRSLTVNNGGTLDLSGTSGATATITRNTGYYGLNVESGGTIGAVYGIFEYMNTSGVNIKNGALVDVAKPFNNCTFRNGQAAGRLMSIENNQTFYVENAVFPPNTWGGTYNVYKAANQGMVYFITASGGFAGAAFEYDPNSRIIWTNRSLALKAYLEGPFNGTNMNTTLNGILPTSHPFNPALPYFGNPMPDWRYTGAGSVGAIPNVNIVDWVLVDLRDAVSAAAATPATSIAKFPAFILNNGNIVGLNGSSNLEFTNVVTNNLFVVIYNRNHQSIMSAIPVPYAAGAYTYDYTTGEAQVHNGALGHKLLSAGKWGMRSGDGNGDGDILLNDKTLVWGISTQLGKTGYLPSDFNFDRQTNNKDKNDKWVPNLGSTSQVP